MTRNLAFYLVLAVITSSSALPEPGQWDVELNPLRRETGARKSLFANSKIYVRLTCNSEAAEGVNVTISWHLDRKECYLDGDVIVEKTINTTSGEKVATCAHDGHIILNEESNKNSGGSAWREAPLAVTTNDGTHYFYFAVEGMNNGKFEAVAHFEMRGTYGYLSAVDWPLLPFYGSMCIVYVMLGLIWLVVSFMQWRDLLRIQFWIGGVILLGMMEKAMFYAEYQSINSTGLPKQGVVLFAEWVSCAKRTLARMLVIIVSLGFGIVKPRLGSMLHRVVGMGSLYFLLACVESYLRIVRTERGNTDVLVASIPLAVLDSILCYWIFTSLVQTTRTLRLRRNMVKLALYRHFTNTLIFAVIVSVFFMLYSIKTNKISDCMEDWENRWIDDAFWHILFSVLLLVIMILWRPTNNNQRYAFTPLLDNPEDEDDEDEDEQFVSDAYGVKMRGPRSSSPRPSKATMNEEDDLRWVEENIPAALHDAALPVLDSDEEVINTKFEVSKMQ